MTTRNAIKGADDKYEEHVLTEVTGGPGNWTLHMGAMCFGGIPKEWKGTPKVGQKVRMWGGLGYPVRGLDIDGQEVYYRTQAEEDEKHHQWCKDQDAKRKSEYEAKRKSYDRRVARLPEVFRVRVEKFREQGDKWRYEYEPYELFCLEEAVKIARALKTPKAIDDFRKLDYKKQKKLVKIGGGHSGNTFGFACMMAKVYLEQPEIAGKVHGSITPLVGCKAFGCH